MRNLYHSVDEIEFDFLAIKSINDIKESCTESSRSYVEEALSVTWWHQTILFSMWSNCFGPTLLHEMCLVEYRHQYVGYFFRSKMKSFPELLNSLSGKDVSLLFPSHSLFNLGVLSNTSELIVAIWLFAKVIQCNLESPSKNTFFQYL